MKRVIFRVDDIHAGTAVSDLEQLYSPLWNCGIPISLAVIPYSTYRFRALGAEPSMPMNIQDNVALVQFINDLAHEGLIEVALHGWQHHRSELSTGTAREIECRLNSAMTILRDAWPDQRIEVLVPPYNMLSPNGHTARHRLGLRLCSSCAVVKGGTRLAHWQVRLRQLMGKPPFWNTGNEVWATDVELMDFYDPPTNVTVHTDYLLRTAHLTGEVLVLVQHYWRLLDLGTLGSWRKWLTQFTDRSDIHWQSFLND